MQFTKRYDSFILAGDVGGTNTALGVFGVKNKRSDLVHTFHFKSRELKSFDDEISKALGHARENFKIKITKACLGVPGVVSHNRDSADIKKLGWKLSGRAIKKKTGLNKVMLINDFEAIGYGVNVIRSKDIKIIKKAEKVPKANILIIGAGTGLGKSLLVFDKQSNFYRPLPSEAGHMDFSAQTDEELEMVQFIKKCKKIKCPVSYEQLLSGDGITNIYLFLRSLNKYKETPYTKEIEKSNSKPELISKYRKTDAACKATFNIFCDNYAKFARNLAIDCFPFGGVYIAGGIAPKNDDIFNNHFIKAFENNYDKRDILGKIPIYLILDYKIGLLGAGFAGAKFL